MVGVANASGARSGKNGMRYSDLVRAASLAELISGRWFTTSELEAAGVSMATAGPFLFLCLLEDPPRVKSRQVKREAKWHLADGVNPVDFAHALLAQDSVERII